MAKERERDWEVYRLFSHYNLIYSSSRVQTRLSRLLPALCRGWWLHFQRLPHNREWIIARYDAQDNRSWTCTPNQVSPHLLSKGVQRCDMSLYELAKNWSTCLLVYEMSPNCYKDVSHKILNYTYFLDEILMGFYYVLIFVILSICIIFSSQKSEIKIFRWKFIKNLQKNKNFRFPIEKDIHILCTQQLDIHLQFTQFRIAVILFESFLKSCNYLRIVSFLRRHFPAWNVSREAIYSKYILYPHRNCEICVKYIRTHFKHKYT